MPSTYDVVIEVGDDIIVEENLDERELREELADRGYTGPDADDLPIEDVLDLVMARDRHVDIRTFPY